MKNLKDLVTVGFEYSEAAELEREILEVTRTLPEIKKRPKLTQLRQLLRRATHSEDTDE